LIAFVKEIRTLEGCSLLERRFRWDSDHGTVGGHDLSDRAHAVVADLDGTLVEIVDDRVGTALRHESLDRGLRVGITCNVNFLLFCFPSRT
jgi:hypothetical protein